MYLYVCKSSCKQLLRYCRAYGMICITQNFYSQTYIVCSLRVILIYIEKCWVRRLYQVTRYFGVFICVFIDWVDMLLCFVSASLSTRIRIFASTVRGEYSCKVRKRPAQRSLSTKLYGTTVVSNSYPTHTHTHTLPVLSLLLHRASCRFTNYHTTNKCTNCMSFIFKSLF